MVRRVLRAIRAQTAPRETRASRAIRALREIRARRAIKARRAIRDRRAPPVPLDYTSSLNVWKDVAVVGVRVIPVVGLPPGSAVAS